MANPQTPPPLIGWPLLPLPDENGELHYPKLEQSIRESIRVILSTRPGEQLMRPEFGGGLDTFLQESNTLTIRRRIHDRVTDSLQRWETRILLDRVEVAEVPNEPSQLRVEIAYRLRRTGAIQQVGITMTLEAS